MDNCSPPSNMGDADIVEVATSDAVCEMGAIDEDGMRREFGGLMVKGGGVNDRSEGLTISDVLVDCFTCCCGVLYSGVSLSSTCLIKEVGVN